MDSNAKHPKVLFYFDFINGVIDEEEDMLLVIKTNLFAINTITLPELEILTTMAINAKTSIDAKIDIDTKTNTNFLFSTHTR